MSHGIGSCLAGKSEFPDVVIAWLQCLLTSCATNVVVDYPRGTLALLALAKGAA